MKAAALLLVLVSLSFAGLAWDVNTEGAVTTKPVEVSNRVVVGTNEGKLYGIENGKIIWSQDLEAPVVADPVVFGGNVVVPTESRVYSVGSSGVVSWSAPIPGIRGVAVSDKVYVASDSGIHAYSAEGVMEWRYETEAPANEPAAAESFVIFSSGKEVLALSATGELFWEKSVGNTWNTRPLVKGGYVYVGTSEGELYSLSLYTGEEVWMFPVTEQITTSPVDFSTYILIGTISGKVYATVLGELAWETQLDGMVEGKIEKVVAGGPLMIFLSTKKALYGLNPADGSILYMRQFPDWPFSPAFVGGNVVAGTEEGKVYAVKPQRACSFISPMQDSLVGDAEFEIVGRSFSIYGEPITNVRMNEGDWTKMNGTEWRYSVDPGPLPYGVIEVECYVSDAGGFETAPFTTLTLIKAPDAEKPKMKVYYPLQMQEGQSFNITVVDENNRELKGVSATLNGETFTGDGVVAITAAGSGLKEITVSKKGYEDVIIYVDAKPSPLIAYAVFALFLIGAGAYAYYFYFSKKKPKSGLQK